MLFVPLNFTMRKFIDLTLLNLIEELLTSLIEECTIYLIIIAINNINVEIIALFFFRKI